MVTVPGIVEMKGREKIAMVTAYDFSSARIADESGVDIVLVGDSLAMVIQGLKSTLSVTVEDMIYHGRIVKRAVKNALVVVDMPFMSYQQGAYDAVLNAGRIVKETGCDAVKLEGGEDYAETVERIVKAGIPVMGHLGLTPQSINVFGSYKARGRDKGEAEKIMKGARALEKVGVFSIVLEAVPYALARDITESVSVPTIGIGAGMYTDGQVLVYHDLLGLFDEFKPKFVKRYADLKEDSVAAIKTYVKEVKSGKFPEMRHSYE